MAAYVGRDVAKLKSKGGKWKYVPSLLHVAVIYLIHSASCHRVVGLGRLYVETGMQKGTPADTARQKADILAYLMIAFFKPCSYLIYHLG